MGSPPESPACLGCSTRFCSVIPLNCPWQSGRDSEAQSLRNGGYSVGSKAQLCCLRQDIVPESGVWAPGQGRRSQCGGGRSGHPSRWGQLGCAALTGSCGDGPGGWHSGGGTQAAGGHLRRAGAGAPGSPARSWQGRCPGVRCRRYGPRTSAHSPCGSGRCAPPGGREGVSVCRALWARHNRGCQPGGGVSFKPNILLRGIGLGEGQQAMQRSHSSTTGW